MVAAVVEMCIRDRIYIAGTIAVLSLMSGVNVDPKSGVFQALTIASATLKITALGIIAAVLVTVGNAGGVGSTVAGISRVPFCLLYTSRCV